MENLKSMIMSRRSMIKRTSSVLLAAGAASAFGPGSARAQGDLRIIMPGGSWKDWFTEVFADPFEAAHDTKITWKIGLNQEPLIMAQQARPQWDLVHTAQTRAEQLGAMGLYRKLSEEATPNLKNIHPSFRYDYLAGKVHTPYGMCVNTKRITRPITSWNDLWDPEFKGKIAFPAWGSWIGEEVFHALNVVFGGDAENIDPGIAKFRELFAENKCVLANNVEHTRQLLESEEVWLMPYYAARTKHLSDAGVPVEFTIPQEGGMSWAWNLASIANRPDASNELADLMLDMTFDPEKQIEMSRLTGYPPTNIEAINNLPSELQYMTLSSNEVELLGKLQKQLNPMIMFAYRDMYAERWNKEVVGS